MCRKNIGECEGGFDEEEIRKKLNSIFVFNEMELFFNTPKRR